MTASSPSPSPPRPIDLEALAVALRALRTFGDLRFEELAPLADGGTMHRHVRIGARGWLARLPTASSFGLRPRARLRLEAAIFRRLAPSGRTPMLGAVIAPSVALPTGLLVVREIVGRPARVPEDLPALAETLAAVHRLPTPPSERWMPIGHDHDPIAGRVRLVRRHLSEMAAAPLSPIVRAALDDELAWAMRLAADHAVLPDPTLALVDSHPGNFVIDRTGHAIFIDLDHAFYGQRTIDIAYASLPSSIRWSLPDAPVPDREDVLAFERAWLSALPSGLADRERPWLRPMRRLTWLRQIVWFARGWAFGKAGTSGRADAAAYRARALAMLMPEAIDRMRAEWIGPTALPPP